MAAVENLHGAEGMYAVSDLEILTFEVNEDRMGHFIVIVIFYLFTECKFTQFCSIHNEPLSCMLMIRAVFCIYDLI